MYKQLYNSNKRIYILIILFFFTVSCNKQDTVENTIYQEGLINEDFVIQKDTTYIQLGNTLEKTEIDEEVISMRDINEKKAYQRIAYDGFVLLVAPSTGKGDVIFQIITVSSTR